MLLESAILAPNLELSYTVSSAPPSVPMDGSLVHTAQMAPVREAFPILSKIEPLPWPVWLSWLECHPIHQNMMSLIPN